jgi:hypothetical protein
MNRKRVIEGQSASADTPAWKFQILVSLVCGSPWFVSALWQYSHGHSHASKVLLLIGIGVGLFNFLTCFNSHSFEIGAILFIFGLILALGLMPFFEKAREKAREESIRYQSRHASTSHPSVSNLPPISPVLYRLFDFSLSQRSHTCCSSSTSASSLRSK